MITSPGGDSAGLTAGDLAAALTPAIKTRDQADRLASAALVEMRTGVTLIAAERHRQIAKGHTASHDRHHNVHQLVLAAGAYLGLCAWPFDRASFRRRDGDGYYVERNLVKAGALIAAAIDRLRDSEAQR